MKNSMVTVEEAERIILSQKKVYGVEKIFFEKALGRVLGEDLKADRDLPPYDRVTMDGIAINSEAISKGVRSFQIKSIQAAGDDPTNIHSLDECIEIMTGAALPETTDTIIRYEDLEIKNGTAILRNEAIRKGQNIHFRGKDKKQNEIVATAGRMITPALLNMAAAIGKSELLVKKLPQVAIISSGDELIGVDETPLPFQIRRSNNYAIKAVLSTYGIDAEMLHIPDDPEIIEKRIRDCLQQFDVLILSGGISMGKFDFIPEVLQRLSVEKLFHKVMQRPGKPFWFGTDSNRVLVFAFPGNPVSTFMCLHRYFLPWLEESLEIPQKTDIAAMLQEDFSFSPPLQYFLQVKLAVNDQGQLGAIPWEGNGSGDFANLLDTDAFMELPKEKTTFKKGDVYRIWPFRISNR